MKNKIKLEDLNVKSFTTGKVVDLKTLHVKGGGGYSTGRFKCFCPW